MDILSTLNYNILIPSIVSAIGIALTYSVATRNQKNTIRKEYQSIANEKLNTVYSSLKYRLSTVSDKEPIFDEYYISLIEKNFHQLDEELEIVILEVMNYEKCFADLDSIAMETYFDCRKKLKADLATRFSELRNAYSETFNSELKRANGIASSFEIWVNKFTRNAFFITIIAALFYFPFVEISKYAKASPLIVFLTIVTMIWGIIAFWGALNVSFSVVEFIFTLRAKIGRHYAPGTLVRESGMYICKICGEEVLFSKGTDFKPCSKKLSFKNFHKKFFLTYIWSKKRP